MKRTNGRAAARLKASLIGGMSVFVYAAPSHAQAGQVLATAAPAATDQSGLGATPQEIIVTAQKRSERLLDVPISITAATGAQLQSKGITSAEQLVKIVPGFTYQQSDFGAPVFGVRGVSFFSVTHTAIPAVAIYVDQIPLPYSILSKGAPLDVERVEVLKGPQGTLFGESTTGGAVNYIAAKPTDHLEAGGDFLYGRFSQTEGGAYVTGPVTSNLLARLAVRTEQRSDWQESVSRNDSTGRRDFNEGRLLLDFKPGTRLHFEFNLNGWIDRSDSPTPQFQKFVPSNPGTNPSNPAYAPAFYAFAGPDAIPAFVVGTIPPGLAPGPISPITGNARAVDFDPGVSLRNNDRFYQTALKSEYDAGFATLTALTSFEQLKADEHTDPDGTPYDNVFVHQVENYRIFTQELRAAGKIGRLRWTLGGYYEYNKVSENTVNINEGSNSTFVGLHYDQYGVRGVQKVNSKAGFAGFDYDLGGGLSLQGSARHTAEKRDFDGCTFAPNDPLGQGLANAFTAASTFLRSSIFGPTTPATPPIQRNQCVTLDTSNPASNPGLLLPVTTVLVNTDRSNTAWKLGANWKPSRNVMVYFNVTKGYKAGSVNNIPAPSSSELFSIKQESVLVYEGGVKALVPSARLGIEAAAFHYEYDNKQVGGRFVDPVFGNLPALVNVPKSTINGAELTVNWRPVARLQLSGSMTYSDATVSKSFVTPDPVGNIVDVKGEQLPGSTKWQGLADAEYRFPLRSNVDAYLGGSITYHSRSNAQFGANPDFALPSYTLLDLRAGLAGANNRWSIEAFGRNVTNEYYWTNVSVSGDVEARYAALPATYGVRLTVHYR
jgi:outer membrane receptor protein involved in Fe transport